MSENNETRGQAILIIALLLVVLIGLIALVIDGGNAYAQRRRAQNAVDAAVLAGAQELTKVIAPGVTSREIWGQVEDYARLNGLDAEPVAEYVDAWFIDDQGDRLLAVNPEGLAKLNKHILVDDGTGIKKEISGLEVQGDLPFDTFFARILGFDTMTARADAKAWILCGIGQGSSLFPIAIATSTVEISGTWPMITPNVQYGPENRYVIWERDLSYPGNFGWVNWEGRSPYPQGPDSPALADNILYDDRSGLWSVGDWIPGSTGVMYSNDVLESLEYRIQQSYDYYRTGSETPPLIVPLYGKVADPTGTNLRYQIYGFGAFYLTCIHYRNNQEIGWDPDNLALGLDAGCTEHSQQDSSEKWIEGYFRYFFGSEDAGNSPDFGVCTVRLRQSLAAPSP